MKAIVCISQTASGQSIQLLGWGIDESEARRAAYEWLHNGNNDFDEEYDGGTLLGVSKKLEELHVKAMGWIDTVDENGMLIEREAPDAHFELLHALGKLFIKDGLLDTQCA